MATIGIYRGGGIEWDTSDYEGTFMKMMSQAATVRVSCNEPHILTLRIYLNNVQLGSSQGSFQSLEAPGFVRRGYFCLQRS